MTNAITVSVAHEIEKRKTLAKKAEKEKEPVCAGSLWVISSIDN